MSGPDPSALLASEQRLRAIYDGTYEYIGVLSPDGTLREANRASLEFAPGTTREDVVGWPFWETVWFTHTPGAPEKLREAIARAAGGETFRVEWPLRRPSGEMAVFDFSLRPIRDSHDDVVLIVPEGRDVTVRQQDEAERDRAEAEREQQRQSEHEISEVLQRSLLPVLAELDGQDLAVRYEPAVDALEVGGDWYDAIALDGGRLAVAVGDVVGKGAAAAAAMGQLRSAARALLLEGHGPAQVLTILDGFARRIPDARCSTVLCGLIDPAAGTVCYSSAGHPPAILDSGELDDPGGQRHELLEGAQSVPLAVVAGLERPEATLPLPPGSTLLLYTDGLVERRGHSIDVGIKAAAAVLADARKLSPAKCAERLINGLVDRTHDDDVALLLYRSARPDRRAAGGVGAAAPLSVNFPADPDELHGLRITLRDWFTALGLEVLAANELLHAIGEVASNAIEHGSRLDPARDVAITGQQDPGWIRVAVSDHGQWVKQAPDSARGRGLMLARALVDRLEISATGAGTTVHLTKRTITP